MRMAAFLLQQTCNETIISLEKRRKKTSLDNPFRVLPGVSGDRDPVLQRQKKLNVDLYGARKILGSRGAHRVLDGVNRMLKPVCRSEIIFARLND